MTAPRFGIAGLALLLCFWTPPRAWSEPVAEAPASAPAAPTLALKTITEVETRRVVPPVSRDTAWAHARATAWLKALRRAAAGLPQRREIRMGVFPAQRQALAAQLYRAAAPPPAAATDNQAGNARLHVPLSLTPRPSAGEELLRALRNPELLSLRHALISETGEALNIMGRHWPGGLEEDGAVGPDNATPATPDAPPDKEETFWRAGEWERMGARLDGLWRAQAALDLSPEGWLTEAAALGALEQAAARAPRSATVRLLLAEAQLQRDLPQQSVESCTEALRLSPGLSRARYIRALAHWRLQQLALAEGDLDAALNVRAGPAPQGAELARRLRARGAVRMLRRDYRGMCADFTEACGLGDCEGLAVARAQNYCRAGEAAAPARPAPATLPRSFLAAPVGKRPAASGGADSRASAPSAEAAP
ncbi:tetratricopeptide repeat protein [Desulfovibrio sp. SGI.169]|uniref:tetratricopeptide repeat protein n=1 Tax=Desulfovibrio sp. SGI.169 TaxID=3420561 RepID=UPI003D0715BE